MFVANTLTYKIAPLSGVDIKRYSGWAYQHLPKMLKKEKKALASISMLIISWSVGLIRFSEKKNEKAFVHLDEN